MYSVAPVHFIWFKLEALEEEEGPSPSLCHPSVEVGELEDPLRPSCPLDVIRDSSPLFSLEGILHIIWILSD